MVTILKVDLDLLSKKKSIEQIQDRLYFLYRINLINIKDITKIELYKKSKYSCKIYVSKEIVDSQTLILFQSILGSDWKHTAVTFRDYKLGIKKFNRLFQVKRYTDGTYKCARVEDITDLILKNYS